MDLSLSKLREIVEDREAWKSMGSQSQTQLQQQQTHNQADCDLGKYLLMEMWHKMESEVTYDMECIVL